ncbi:pectate lyase [Pedobacter sp. P351]|uniref:pectate lyase n=1 Tax=Pedobacter superstes TaxID=3133441 RepID=UPI003098C222
MRRCAAIVAIALSYLVINDTARAQTNSLAQKAEKAMVKATKFMVDEVSTEGGYVWYYTTDLSRRWGEMEAYKSMIWIQGGGTVTVGHTLLDAYRATGNDYFYEAAGKAASALIKGQSTEGGWNYMIDFAGQESLKNWYNTIGKNGWRLEEFQHYYGNDTYDDDVTSDAARFLLKMYMQKKEIRYKEALDKAINFILKSQYPNGGWPQRYPLKSDFNKAGFPDYSSFYTFNDSVIWENINFLIQCFQVLHEERFLGPIRRGMDFYLLSQQPNGAWGQQYNMKMEPASARTYEPAALLPGATAENCSILLRFYQYTGDRKYLARIPDAISWLEKVKLPASMTLGGRYTHPLYVELKTDKPLFVHRKGSNVKYGYYYADYDDQNLLAHMLGKRSVNIASLRDEYIRVSALSPGLATRNSPLKTGHAEKEIPDFYFSSTSGRNGNMSISEERVNGIISSLDSRNRWLVKGVSISNPYIGEGQNKEATTEYASTFVGDKTDTSPFRDTSDTYYISTPAYIRNMNLLIQYIISVGKTSQN